MKAEIGKTETLKSSSCDFSLPGFTLSAFSISTFRSQLSAFQRFSFSLRPLSRRRACPTVLPLLNASGKI
jgi:hypothetical protein